VDGKCPDYQQHAMEEDKKEASSSTWGVTSYMGLPQKAATRGSKERRVCEVDSDTNRNWSWNPEGKQKTKGKNKNHHVKKEEGKQRAGKK